MPPTAPSDLLLITGCHLLAIGWRKSEPFSARDARCHGGRSENSAGILRPPPMATGMDGHTVNSWPTALQCDDGGDLLATAVVGQ